MLGSKFEFGNYIIQAKCQRCVGDLCDLCAIARPWTCLQCKTGNCFDENICVGCRNEIFETKEMVPVVREVTDREQTMDKKRKRKDMIEGVVVNAKRKVPRKMRRCTTCLKDFYDEYGLEEICDDCGFEGLKRKADENTTTKLLADHEQENANKSASEWTEEDIKMMLKLHAQKVDDDAIGNMLHRSASAVRSKRVKMKLQKQYPSKGIRRDFSVIPEAVKCFMKRSKIASKTEISDHIHEQYPKLADKSDITPQGRIYYEDVLYNTLRYTPDLYKKIGKKGRCGL